MAHNLNLSTSFLRKSLISLFMILCFFVLCNTLVKSEEQEKKVLFISSYSESFPNVPLEIEGMKEVLQSEKISFDIEYMDTKRFDTEEHQVIFYQMLKYKLDKLVTYDAIIVGDDSALQFALDHQEEIFDGIPIVFLGVNDTRRVEQAGLRDNITGIVEELSIMENIETALKINKDAKKVVAIVDATITGKGDKEQFYAVQDSFSNLEFSDINTSDYTIEELKQRFETIEKDTIVIYLSMNESKTKNVISIDEASTLLGEHTKVPVYRAEVGGVGLGILGGKMVSYEDSGKMAAEMVLKIFHGTSIESIEINYNSPNKYVFDYEVIEKYNIDKGLLPKDATFINKEPSFYEQYKQLVWAIIAFIGFLIIISAILIVDNIMRRKMEKLLVENNQKLSETHEKLSEMHEELTASEEELRAQYETTQEHMNMIEILNQKYQIAIDSTGIAVWELNLHNKMISVSKNFAGLVKKPFEEQEDVYEFIDKLLTPEDKKLLLQEYYSYKQGEKNEINVQIAVIDKDQNLKWLLIRGKGLLGTSGYFRMMNGIILDITKMKEQDNYIQHLASHDYLTNLPNRRAFLDKLKSEIDNERLGAIFLLDLDDFKSINDTLGHIYGDEVLKETASRLLELASESLFVSRFGGDEFLILISNVSDQETIMQYIEVIQKQFEKVVLIDKKENYLKCSIGIARFPQDGKNGDKLIMKADTAMYKAKQDGKNNYLFYHQGMKDFHY